jgi:hypothetical protein
METVFDRRLDTEYPTKLLMLSMALTLPVSYFNCYLHKSATEQHDESIAEHIDTSLD